MELRRLFRPFFLAFKHVLKAFECTVDDETAPENLSRNSSKIGMGLQILSVCLGITVLAVRQYPLSWSEILKTS